jgi:hypothetical protein
MPPPSPRENIVKVLVVKPRAIHALIFYIFMRGRAKYFWPAASLFREPFSNFHVPLSFSALFVYYLSYPTAIQFLSSDWLLKS